MSMTRLTAPMRRSLESRLEDLDRRIETLNAQREGDETLEVAVLVEQLVRERADVADALRDATLIDDEPFDTEAIEIGDTVTIRDREGVTHRYVLIDRNVRTRARSNWVSASSPLGTALLGSSRGASIQVDSPSGTIAYDVIDFERASDDVVVPAMPGERVTAGVYDLPSEAFHG